MQSALDIRSSSAAAPVRIARPVLVARNGDQLPVNPVESVAAFKRIGGQDDSQTRSARRSDEALHKAVSSAQAIAAARGPVTAPPVSSQFIAQQFAQEDLGQSRQSKQAENQASVAAYGVAAERGTVFFGLEYPVDFSV